MSVLGAVTSLAAAAVLGGLAMAPVAQAAAPTSPTDASKVPHYFGPWPNWALSPLTTNNAQVTILGDGTGATAVGNVDPLTGPAQPGQ